MLNNGTGKRLVLWGIWIMCVRGIDSGIIVPGVPWRCFKDNSERLWTLPNIKPTVIYANRLINSFKPTSFTDIWHRAWITIRSSQKLASFPVVLICCIKWLRQKFLILSSVWNRQPSILSGVINNWPALACGHITDYRRHVFVWTRGSQERGQISQLLGQIHLTSPLCPTQGQVTSGLQIIFKRALQGYLRMQNFE